MIYLHGLWYDRVFVFILMRMIVLVCSFAEENCGILFMGFNKYVIISPH